MKYQPGHDAKDDICECGHNICIHLYKSKFFMAIYDDHPTPHCPLCMCPKFAALTGGST